LMKAIQPVCDRLRYDMPEPEDLAARGASKFLA
jgi:hypothetical protein